MDDFIKQIKLFNNISYEEHVPVLWNVNQTNTEVINT